MNQFIEANILCNRIVPIHYRTGVVAGLILNLVGAFPQDIVTNYETTHTNINSIIPQISYEAPEIPLKMYDSIPLYMETFLAHLYCHYGSAGAYLIKIGVDKKYLDNIRKTFLI